MSAAIFLVTDTNNSSSFKSIMEAEGYIENARSILYKQTRTAESFCAGEHNYSPPAEFCSWIKVFKNYLIWLQDKKSFTRNDDDIPSLKNILLLGKTDEGWPDRIENHIQSYNTKICSNAKLRHHCEIVPLVLNNHPKLTGPSTSIVQEYAIAVEPLIPTITRYWYQSMRKNRIIEQSNKSPHIRWLFFITIGFIAGGKVAISSRNILGGREESVYRSAIFRGIGFIRDILSYIVKRLKMFLKMKHYFLAI